LNEVETDRWHLKQAVSYVAKHPHEWLQLTKTKAKVLWSPAIMPSDLPPHAEEIDSAVLLYHTPAFQAARLLHQFYYTPLLALAVGGLLAACWDRRLAFPILAVLGVITIVYLVFHPSTRYRSPGDPLLFVLSAYMVARSSSWWYRYRLSAPRKSPIAGERAGE